MKKEEKKLVSCKVNGKDVSLPEGSTVIQAFKKTDQDLAHYCWHPGLSIAGVCRLCMVEIEGNPKLQIACNTKVVEGMVISNESNQVKEAVRWGLEFHLINHPLDCPICDQAGECELQDQYMEFGSYRPTMSLRKVKKRKVVDLGSKIVLDTERCILCTRCVRFCSEVTKTNELGIFDRGDRSEIGTFKDKPLENNYALNTVDICPVGALTDKNFRFKQRVWYLKTKPSVCNGCSTGCNTYVDYNEEGIWRVRPRYNEKINGHWMCDKGRNLFQNLKKEKRLRLSLCEEEGEWKKKKTKELLEKIRKENEFKNVALVLTGQYTNEEYESLKKAFPEADSFYWQNNLEDFESFDKLLFRGDKNPNTKGLKKSFSKMKDILDLENKISNYDMVFVLGPEGFDFYPCLEEKTKIFSKAKSLIWFSVSKNPYLKPKKNHFQIPMLCFFEKGGSFTNFQGETQSFPPGELFSSQALSLTEALKFLEGEGLKKERKQPYFKHNQFLGHFKKVW